MNNEELTGASLLLGSIMITVGASMMWGFPGFLMSCGVVAFVLGAIDLIQMRKRDDDG